jgi:hypothetical protein
MIKRHPNEQQVFAWCVQWRPAPGQSGEGKQAKARPSFLKKRSKKLLTDWASAFLDGLSPDNQKFFGSFFQKRTAFFLHPIALPNAPSRRDISRIMKRRALKIT